MVPLSEGVGEPALARADGGGTHRSGSRRLMQLVQGNRLSHFCFRRKHSTQLYCSRGLFAVALLSFLLCSLAVLVRDEDAAQVEEDGSWSTGLSALMGELSEASIWYRGEETPAVRESAVAVV